MFTAKYIEKIKGELELNSSWERVEVCYTYDLLPCLCILVHVEGERYQYILEIDEGSQTITWQEHCFFLCDYNVYSQLAGFISLHVVSQMHKRGKEKVNWKKEGF